VEIESDCVHQLVLVTYCNSYQMTSWCVINNYVNLFCGSIYV